MCLFFDPLTSFDKEALGRILTLAVRSGQSLYTCSAGYHIPLGQHQDTQISLIINMLVAKESILSSGTPFSVGVRSVRQAGNPITDHVALAISTIDQTPICEMDLKYFPPY